MQSSGNRSHTSLWITAVSKRVKPKFSLAEQAEPSMAWLTGSRGTCLLGAGHGIRTLKDTVKGHMARCTGKLAVPKRMETGWCGHWAAWAQHSQAAGHVIPLAWLSWPACSSWQVQSVWGRSSHAFMAFTSSHLLALKPPFSSCTYQTWIGELQR